MQKTNALGFTRFELANVKRAFAANKTIYRKMDTLKSKIEELAGQYEDLQKLSLTWEQPIYELSNQKLGVQLNSRQVLEYSDNVEKFHEDFPDTVLPTVAPEETEESEETSQEASEGFPF